MIKNYTSEVLVSRSIMHIEDRLVAFGACNIMKDYDDKGQIDALLFTIPSPENPGKNIVFRVPVDIKAIEGIFVRRFPKKKIKTIEEQAPRTAWKIASDWIDIQLSFVEMGQVEFRQVFLAYIYNPIQKKTFYKHLKDSGFNLLEYK